MIVFTLLADSWEGKWFRVKRHRASHNVIQRATGRYLYQPAWLLFQFPLSKGCWVKVMLIKFWKRGWYE